MKSVIYLFFIFLTSFIVNGSVGQMELKKILGKLFNSLSSDDYKETQHYTKILQRENQKKKTAFNEWIEELRQARSDDYSNQKKINAGVEGNIFKREETKSSSSETTQRSRGTIRYKLSTANFTTMRYTDASLKFPSFMPMSEKHQGLFEELAETLSYGDEEKKKILSKPIKGFFIMRSCYLDVFGYFMAYCQSCYDKSSGLKLFRDLFHRACEAKWLTTKNITVQVTRVCQEQNFVTVGSWL